MKNKYLMRLVLLFAIIHFTNKSIAQDFKQGQLYVRSKVASAIPDVSEVSSKKNFQFRNSHLENIFKPYKLKEFRQAFPRVLQFDHPNAEP